MYVNYKQLKQFTVSYVKKTPFFFKDVMLEVGVGEIYSFSFYNKSLFTSPVV